MASTYLVFVPGIMGSELFVPGPSPRFVWADDLRTLIHTLLFEPWILEGHRYLEVGDVLSGPLGYQDLLSFLAQNNFHTKSNFLPFGYDWRQPTSTNATQLVSKLADILRSSSDEINFTLLGHSMGCLIIRAAVLFPGAPVQAIQKIIEIAPPHRGAAKAFRQLNQVPDLHPIVCLIRKRFPHLAQRIDDAFSVVTRSLPGLWDLLPPEDERILEEIATGSLTAALGWKGWTAAGDVSGEVTKDRYELYARIFANGWPVVIDSALVVGTGLSTECGFLYSGNPPFTVNFTKPKTTDDGDGTVLSSSAEWLISAHPTRRCPPVIQEHHALTRNTTVLNWVLSEIP
ncbi:MAG: hypothetical protein HYY45_14100 [Deltaproteobacteria bacterium]|nr:hypothetical protein [Deltaproteobacteria bacterium]